MILLLEVIVVVSDLCLQIPVLVDEYVELLPELVYILPLHLEVLHVYLRVLEALAARHLVLHELRSDVLAAAVVGAHLRVEQALVLYGLQLGCKKGIVKSSEDLQSWFLSWLLRRVTSRRRVAIWLISSIFSFMMLLLS